MSQTVDVAAAFLGLRFLPRIVAIGSNSINPRLILHDEQIEYRALFVTNRISYADIEQVDVYLQYKTANLHLTRRNSVFTFAGNLASKAKLIEVVTFLKGKNCVLSDRATALLAQTS